MFDTDKIRLGYLPTYQHLASQIGPHGRVCEIGVFRGGSLELWQSLFPLGVVVGVDRDPGAHWPPGAGVVVCDQTDPALPAKLLGISEFYDLIVDDASHDGPASRTTFELLWPLIRPGGWYVLEDWMIAYPALADTGVGWHDPSMLDTARSFLDHLDQPGDVDHLTYRYGQIIVAKANHRA